MPLHRFRTTSCASLALAPGVSYLQACAAMLDRLRALFPYIVAVALPLAGAILAVVRFAEGDRDDGLRIAAAALFGAALYALLLL
jgi:hypothetical protein